MAKKAPKKAPAKKAAAKKITNQRTGNVTRRAAAVLKPNVFPKTLPFARTFVDPISKFLLALQVVTSDSYKAKSSPAAVNISTIVNNVAYEEQVEFQTCQRALEYVADYSAVQSQRFAMSALAAYEQSDREHNPDAMTAAEEPKRK